MRIAIIAAVFSLVAGTAFFGPVEVAEAARYCAVQGGSEGYRNCGCRTFRQCRAAVSGVGGYCMRIR